LESVVEEVPVGEESWCPEFTSIEAGLEDRGVEEGVDVLKVAEIGRAGEVGSAVQGCLCFLGAIRQHGFGRAGCVKARAEVGELGSAVEGVVEDGEGGRGAEEFGAVEDDDLGFAGVDGEAHVMADTSHAVDEELEVCRGAGQEGAVISVGEGVG
jgi:hypothetical protein